MRTGARVQRCVTERRRVVGVELAGGERLSAPLVIADIMPKALVDLAGEALPQRYAGALRRFRAGPATLKVDWALDGEIPWTALQARQAGTIHLCGSAAEVLQSTVVADPLPERPFMLLGQQSLADPTRAPAGKHTAWAYTHGPHSVDWAIEGDRHVERMEAQVERFAPGFRERILARHVLGPGELQRRNANLVGGDVGGGSYSLDQVFSDQFPRSLPIARRCAVCIWAAQPLSLVVRCMECPATRRHGWRSPRRGSGAWPRREREAEGAYRGLVGSPATAGSALASCGAPGAWAEDSPGVASVHTGTLATRPADLELAHQDQVLGAFFIRSLVESATNSMWPLPLVMPSRREAVLVVSPSAVYSTRCSEPMLPAITGPLLRPTPIANAWSWPCSASHELKCCRRGPIISGRRERAVCVVGLLDRRSKHGHDPVAHVRDQGAAGVRIASVISLR